MCVCVREKDGARERQEIDREGEIKSEREGDKEREREGEKKRERERESQARLRMCTVSVPHPC